MTASPSAPATNPPLHIAFIGGGQMSRALIAGLRSAGSDHFALSVADPYEPTRLALPGDFPGLTVSADNDAVAAAADVWVLAVKPQQMPEVARGLAALAPARRPLVISVAAGIRASDLERWLGPSASVVRAMPNRPALVGAGVTALFASPSVDAAHRRLAEQLLAAVGSTVWVESDAQVDAATAISGSGPAYFLRLIELLEAAAIDAGLSPDTANRLAIGTALGTARLANESAQSCAELRASVTSAGGTTAAALAVLEGRDLRGIVNAAVRAAANRAAELADEFGAR